MSLPSSAKYLVIGAGIHGLSTAWHLAQEQQGGGRVMRRGGGGKLLRRVLQRGATELRSPLLDLEREPPLRISAPEQPWKRPGALRRAHAWPVGLNCLIKTRRSCARKARRSGKRSSGIGPVYRGEIRAPAWNFPGPGS